MSENYNISSSPHVRSKVTTSNIMLLVVIALLPATIFGVFHFGINALILVLVSVITSVLTEYAYQKLMKKKVTISDYSAVVTGLLLALNLPSSAPWWIAAIGGVFAILVVKQLFGGLGQNFMNPALGARCFLMISFTGRMTNFAYDTFTGATPLAELKADGMISSFNSTDLVTGFIPGTIGETSVIAIIIGAMILIWFDVIDIKIPATYIISFSIFVLLFGGHGLDMGYLALHLSSGGLMLGAWFMATDYVTAPISYNGKIVYGICLGLFTGIFRIFGASAEGVSYAIIFCNLLVPLIEKVTLPKPFGKGGEK